ncbi:MAG: VOC family protein [Planctomycetota bacterium]|nr:VOC family protein [Planctomycetota bacterium]
MDIEHIGYQAPDPVAAARWYVENLGFRVARSFGEPAFAQFLADSSGHVMIEIYNNPAAPMPEYRSMSPLVLHLALECRDVEGDRARLLAAGATAEGDIVHGPTGDTLAMLRDPWGFPLQLARRASPMI